MENKQPTQMDLLIESHLGLKRQGPGSTEMTLKALSFVVLPDDARIADLGCGTGGQTMVLAQNTNNSSITGVDFISAFIEVFNSQAGKLSLQDRVRGVVGSIDDLSFEKNSLDLIWSEGVIDSLGFGKMLAYWNGFLKKSGYVVVTCPSWLSDERPAEVQKFWSDAGSGMDSIESNIVTLRECGYRFIAAFVLPEECWTENYYNPRKAAEKQLLEKYPGSEAVTEYVRSMAYEVELFDKFKQYYGYVFYIGRKM
ncbi:class I SAM-dependent methyltransferase [Christensenellaceae bacterium OttesenSCG-928-M15]|nr:class I SAM-dependent methyltransferase [Christensenellaceae bacterium OttesenSCG-928-M15]